MLMLNNSTDHKPQTNIEICVDVVLCSRSKGLLYNNVFLLVTIALITFIVGLSDHFPLILHKYKKLMIECFSYYLYLSKQRKHLLQQVAK